VLLDFVRLRSCKIFCLLRKFGHALVLFEKRGNGGVPTSRCCKKKLPGEIAGENREVHFRRGPFEIN
jgi:hypothetical protein